MDPITAIETALVAGATAGASGIAKKAVTDAYAGLKKLLASAYKFVSTTLLESDPKELSYHKAVRTELEKQPAIADDEAVLKQAQAVHEALKKEPKENLAAWGIDVEEIEAAGAVIIEHTSGTGGGLRAKRIKGKSVRISNTHGGTSSPGKP